MRCRDVEVYLKSSLKFIVYSTQAYVMLPVHPHAVREGLEHGALGAMSSYNEVDGVPTSADPWVLLATLP